MGTGHPAGCTNLSDDLPLFHIPPLFHKDLGKMAIIRKDTDSMINHNRVSRKIQIGNQHDTPEI